MNKTEQTTEYLENHEQKCYELTGNTLEQEADLKGITVDYLIQEFF